MKTFLLGTLFTNLSPSNQKIGTTSDDASAETLSNVVTKSGFNVILLQNFIETNRNKIFCYFYLVRLIHF